MIDMLSAKSPWHILNRSNFPIAILNNEMRGFITSNPNEKKSFISKLANFAVSFDPNAKY